MRARITQNGRLAANSAGSVVEEDAVTRCHGGLRNRECEQECGRQADEVCGEQKPPHEPAAKPLAPSR